MPRRIEFPAEAEIRLKTLLYQATDLIEIKRIQSVYFRVKYNHSSQEIADMVGYHPDYVRWLQAQYLMKGDRIFKRKTRGGAHHQNLSFEEELKFLSQFQAEAEKGHVLEVSQLKTAYQNLIGKSVPKSTVYRMLARHGWRKVMPRPVHPKNNPADILAFKKTSRTW